MTEKKVDVSLSLPELLIIFSAIVHQEDSDVVIARLLQEWRARFRGLEIPEEALTPEVASHLRTYIEGFILQLTDET